MPKTQSILEQDCKRPSGTFNVWVVRCNNYADYIYLHEKDAIKRCDELRKTIDAVDYGCYYDVKMMVVNT